MLMKAKIYEPRKVSTWQDIYAQDKFDGVRAFLAVMPKEVQLLSITQHNITTVPLIIEAAQKLPQGIYDGELWSSEYDLPDIVGMVNRNEPHENHTELRFMCFDLMQLELNFNLRNQLRQDVLNDFVYNEFITPVRTWRVSQNTIDDEFQKALKRGQEGLILRNGSAKYVPARTGEMLKLKDIQEDDFTIIDFIEERDSVGHMKNRLGVLVAYDETTNVEVNVYSGITDVMRKTIWQNQDAWRGKRVRISYQLQHRTGKLRHPRVKKFIEMPLNQ